MYVYRDLIKGKRDLHGRMRNCLFGAVGFPGRWLGQSEAVGACYSGIAGGLVIERSTKAHRAPSKETARGWPSVGQMQRAQGDQSHSTLITDFSLWKWKEVCAVWPSSLWPRHPGPEGHGRVGGGGEDLPLLSSWKASQAILPCPWALPSLLGSHGFPPPPLLFVSGVKLCLWVPTFAKSLPEPQIVTFPRPRWSFQRVSFKNMPRLLQTQITPGRLWKF